MDKELITMYIPTKLILLLSTLNDRGVVLQLLKAAQNKTSSMQNYDIASGL